MDFNALNPNLAFDFGSLVPGGVGGLFTVILKDDPLLYYRLQETGLGNVKDYSKNVIDGTSSGTITFDVSGPTSETTDSAFEFVSGFITIPDAGALDTTFGGGFSIECWIRVIALPNEEQTIVSRGSGPGHNHYQVSLGADHRVKFWFSDNTAPTIAYSDATLVINTWYHIVCVWTGTENLIYLNGTAGTPVANTPSVTTSAVTGQVGAFNNGGRFVGRIDEVAIYDKVMSQDDVNRRFAFDASINTYPVITFARANGQASGTVGIYAGDSVTFLITASDADGDTLYYSFSPDGWIPSVGPQLGNTTTVQFNEIGVFNPVAFVTDGKVNRARLFPKIDVDPLPDLQAFGDSRATGFRTSVTIFVLNNDSFPIGGGGSISSVATPSGGTTEILGSGETARIRYTPNMDFSGEDTFQYTITDGVGHFATATVTVTVAEKQPPRMSPYSITVDPDSVDNRLRPQSNDRSDPPGETLTLISVQNPSAQGGVVIIDYDTNEVVYTPPVGYTGSDSFGYQIEDEAGLTGSSTVNVTVSPIVFEAKPDNYSHVPYETTGYVMPVLSNDTTSYGFPLSVVAVTSPPLGEGTVSITPDGKYVTYVSSGTGFIGSTSFTYDMDDGHGHSASATVNLTVVNRPPVAPHMRLSTNINTDRVFDPRGAAYDPEGGVLGLLSFTQPSNGTTTRVGNSTPENTDDMINYSPNLGFEGIDSFSYTVEDPQGYTATNTINVAVGFTLSLTVNQVFGPVTENFVFNANVSASTGGYDKSYSYFWDFQDGTTSTSKSKSHKFTGIGQFTVSCTVTDSYGVVHSDTIDVEVTANARPIAHDDTLEVAEGQVLNFDPRDNDEDPDNDRFFISNVDGTSALGGTVAINSGTSGSLYDDYLTYVHPAIAAPFADTFSYTIEDEFGLTASATVTVNVTANQPPVAAPIYQLIVFNRTTDIRVLDYASDPENDDLYVNNTSTPSGGISIHGSASVVGSGPNATYVRYNPNNTYLGAAGFDYTIRDTHYNMHQSTVTMAVFGQYYPAMVASHNPISYWPMNEGASITVLSDAIDGTNVGSYVGVITRDEIGPLAKDLLNCARVDAGSAVVNISKSHADFTDQFTLEFWIRAEGNSGSTPVNPFVKILPGGTSWNFTIEADTSETILATGFEVNEWYHICMTYDGEWVRVYRDGEAISGREMTGNIKLPNQIFFGQGTLGRMSDVALYNHCLAPAQINQHYAEALGPVVAFKVESSQDEVTPGEEFFVTVKGRDVTDKTVKTDNSTVVHISSDGTIEFDADGNGTWGS